MNDLNTIIQAYVGQGYRVTSQTETTAQLVKPKQFSCGLAIVLLLLAVLPFILYVIVYAASKDQTRFIVVLPDGKFQVTSENGQAEIFDTTAALLAKTNPPKQAANVTNDPGLAVNTKVALVILAAVMIFVIYLAFFAR